MNATVRRDDDGTWSAVSGDGKVIADRLTNAQAWRAADKANREPVNRSQVVSDWAFSKQSECTGRKPMTKFQAFAVAKKLDESGGQIQPYQCKECGQWHIYNKGR